MPLGILILSIMIFQHCDWVWQVIYTLILDLFSCYIGVSLASRCTVPGGLKVNTTRNQAVTVLYMKSGDTYVLTISSVLHTYSVDIAVVVVVVVVLSTPER